MRKGAVEPDTINVVSKNNVAGINGEAIFSESFTACIYQCFGTQNSNVSMNDVFNCTGNFMQLR